MKAYTAVIEQCSDTGMYVGYVPGFPGGSQSSRVS
jgi:predicted RNase H-like HicB family nuclease